MAAGSPWRTRRTAACMPVLVAAAVLVFAYGTATAEAQACSLPSDRRQDCGYLGIGQGECEGRGCCWSPLSIPGQDVPWCFYKDMDVCRGYSVVAHTPTATGLRLALSATGPCNLYGPDYTALTVQVDYETSERLHVKISPTSSARWEVPELIFPRPVITEAASDPAYDFTYTEVSFGFAVTRRSTGDVVFNTTADLTNNGLLKALIYEEQYMEISSILPDNANLYGLGERVRPLRLAEGIPYTMWSADEATPQNQNVYGTHPYYVEMRNGRAHGVLLMNSNGMDVTMADRHITYQVIGGVLDFYFFLGPTPAAVNDQYTALVGRPSTVAYWTLGFHQCRYGYPDLDTVKNVVARYREADIPLETMWIDIEYGGDALARYATSVDARRDWCGRCSYMDEYKDWTFDSEKYPAEQVRAFVEGLHANEQYNVLIVDPAIKNLTGYKYYDVGLELDVFIKDARTREPMIGMVWPYYTVFPDFLNPTTDKYWRDSISDFYNLVDVDGLWIDMNEPASFCQGADLSTCNYPGLFGEGAVTGSARTHRPGPRVAFDPVDPPYRINNGNSRRDLDVKTTATDAYHYNGVLEYDAHNLYGIAEAISTFKGMKALRPSERPFLLSRSTFVGHGRYGGHWTGDNFSTFEHLYLSIAGMLNFQLFGIPFVGADICGFIFDTTEELCARWAQLGAFYPFARNHNGKGYASQEFYRWDSVASIARESLRIRYALLPFWYTLFEEASRTGAAVVRPLFYEFPSDPAVLDNDRQFLLGPSVLVSPVLTQGARSVSVYFPPGTWYDYYTYATVLTTATGERRTVDAPLDFLPLHIRGGHVIPRQDPGYTTAASRRNPFEFVVALDADGTAAGSLYLDDGYDDEIQRTHCAVDSIGDGHTHLKGFRSENGTDGIGSARDWVGLLHLRHRFGRESAEVTQATRLACSASGQRFACSGTYEYDPGVSLQRITVLGVPQRPQTVTVNNVPVTTYAYSGQVLTILELSVSLTEPLVVVW